MPRQKQTYEPATLASTLAWNHHVNVRCLDCHRSVDLDMAALIERYGPDLPIPVLGERLVQRMRQARRLHRREQR